jgi:tryptophanyl-tRNA synthetase
LTDDADGIAQKIRKAKTDAEPLPETAEGLNGRPEAANLVNIYAALSDRTRDDVLVEMGGKAFSEFKTLLTDLSVSVLSPMTQRMNELMADPAEIDAILAKGAERANAIAGPIIDEVYEAVGFLKP